MSTFNL